MTAFAAIVWPDDQASDNVLVADISAVLHDLAGVFPTARQLMGCTLLSAPPSAADHSPGCDEGVGIVGQVLLQDREARHQQFGSPSGSDLSIVLAAYARWQADCTRRLDGEFAFALWDARQRELLAARDGLGVRLLYVAKGARALIVSNVMQAALCDREIGSALDPEALAAFLTNGGPTDPVRTVYRGVRVVPPGHTLRVGRGQRSLTRHWHFPAGSPANDLRPPALREAYRSVLTQAVGDRLRDVGAIFLSGGIDSGTLAACLPDLTRTGSIRAITAVHDRFSSIDEISYARMTAEWSGLPLDSISGDRHRALEAHDSGCSTPEPLDEPSLADWRDFVGAATPHGSAALYGEDGDALFSPPGFPALGRTGSMRSLAAAAGRYVIRHRHLPYFGLRLRERIGITRQANSEAPAWVNESAKRMLATNAASILGMTPTPLDPHPTRPEVQARLGLSISRSLATLASPEITRQRLELRFPLLDTRIIRFIVSVPPIPWCQNKALAREAFRDRLPPAVLQRPKTPVRGFEDAVTADWRRHWNGRILRLSSPLDEWIDMAAWERALRRGSALEIMAAWRVIELDAWLARRAVPHAAELARV